MATPSITRCEGADRPRASHAADRVRSALSHLRPVVPTIQAGDGATRPALSLPHRVSGAVPRSSWDLVPVESCDGHCGRSRLCPEDRQKGAPGQRASALDIGFKALNRGREIVSRMCPQHFRLSRWAPAEGQPNPPLSAGAASALDPEWLCCICIVGVRPVTVTVDGTPTKQHPGAWRFDSDSIVPVRHGQSGLTLRREGLWICLPKFRLG